MIYGTGRAPGETGPPLCDTIVCVRGIVTVRVSVRLRFGKKRLTPREMSSCGIGKPPNPRCFVRVERNVCVVSVQGSVPLRGIVLVRGIVIVRGIVAMRGMVEVRGIEGCLGRDMPETVLIQFRLSKKKQVHKGLTTAARRACVKYRADFVAHVEKPLLVSLWPRTECELNGLCSRKTFSFKVLIPETADERSVYRV